MSSDATRMKILLSNSDLTDLKSALPDGSVTRQRTGQTNRFRAGDLSVAEAFIVLTPTVVHALAVWMAKQRTKGFREEDMKISKAADGSWCITINTRSEGHTSAPPPPATVEALRAKLTQLAKDLGASAEDA